MLDLNHKLYTAAQVRGLDNAAIHEFNIAGYELMCRAGKAVVAAARDRYPQTNNWLVLCGSGNNGGDGYVVARLAAAAGINITIYSLLDPELLQGDAATAFKAWIESNGKVQLWPQVSEPHSPTAKLQIAEQVNQTTGDLAVDLVFDALLGTGIDRDVEGVYREAIEYINGVACPVVAIDMPSGLNADTGCVMATAVCAQLSVSFVGKKRGMFTADGPDLCGRIIFSDLGIPPEVAGFLVATGQVSADQVNTDQAGPDQAGTGQVGPDHTGTGQSDTGQAGELLSAAFLTSVLNPRSGNSHKGSYGEVLAVGGAKGMSGAILLCGEAALRSGAGKVRLATDPEHAGWINLTRPELMVLAIANGDDLNNWLKPPRVLALGPGLGRGAWSQSVLQACLASDLKMVVDADALNLLAESEHQAPARQVSDLAQITRVLSPHPAEAAGLMHMTTAQIQQNRVGSAQALAKKYQAVVVLKGAGSVIASPDGHYAICPYGNPGMATAGSGDVLTGIIAALLAQGLSCFEAAQAGVIAHALAGDLADQEYGEMAMLAGDITNQLHAVWQAATSGDKSGSMTDIMPGIVPGKRHTGAD